ncbi:Sec1 family protein [Lasiosphaeria ovina]|uniref:Sec1 family protein n=1 Tax=Lasiosphaeria ovina TaxID=92902 RepID=A0AAE0NEE0_9PEZI|nr:Sec1 family protein [Lasiosphaeria ovina]
MDRGGISIIDQQKDAIISAVKKITQGEWKVLVVDENAKRILDNTVKEADLLNNNIANIERIEEKRDMNPGMDAIYILSPQPHIVQCLVADFERRRYRRAFLLWTAILPKELSDMLRGAKSQIAGYKTLLVDFYPRESHLVTFQDPYSFPVLYHPSCNDLVAKHLQTLAQRIVGICIALGEMPKVRYYRPKNPTHEAAVLCTHLARFVQKELDAYQSFDPNFSAPTSRPQPVLVITDRSMDLVAPLVHEFTYQAIAHDLLPVKDGEKVTYCVTFNEGTDKAEEKVMELAETDSLWIENRHRHMIHTIEKLGGDFKKFLESNAHFTKDSSQTTMNTIKAMMADMPEYTAMKELYSLHVTMAQEALRVFGEDKIPDLAPVEQTLATGLDDDLKKPKNVLDQVVRLLDQDGIKPLNRLRLIALYILYRDGLIPEDINRLLAHSSLPQSEADKILNFDLLGAQTTHGLKDARPAPPPLFPRTTINIPQEEEYITSRFEPAVKSMLEDLCRGSLDPDSFPYTNPPPDVAEESLASQASLRSAAPRWASANRRQVENRQRIIVFMAGGATYSEARACYEVSEKLNRDIFLATSHMLSPELFLRQVGDLSVDRRRLGLPMDQPKPRPPAHIFDPPTPPAPMSPPFGVGPGGSRSPPVGVQPPSNSLAAMTLNGPASQYPVPPQLVNGGPDQSGASIPPDSGKPNKLSKEKKLRGLFGKKK